MDVTRYADNRDVGTTECATEHSNGDLVEE
jgi:hypothetical protein